MNKTNRPRPHLRPSIYEQPILRIRFETQDGQTHQSTLTSSWGKSPGLHGLRLNHQDQAALDFRAGIIRAITALYEGPLGCRVQSVEHVVAEYSDLTEHPLPNYDGMRARGVLI